MRGGRGIVAIAEAGARQRVTITDNVILDFTGLFREAEKRGQASDIKERIQRAIQAHETRA